MDLTLPLDHAAIERVLPHRYPFLLVDRIIEFEVDKRIVGIKNVSFNDPYLSHAAPGEAPALPPTILTEGIAQVGAIMILAKPENRQRVPLLTGIQRVRYRRTANREMWSCSRPWWFDSAAAWGCSRASPASTTGLSPKEQ
jgi:3-hydroxyacyl-[acyl-carrier-protein] dehydratase